MLRVVLELSDITEAVGRPEQVGLRAAPKWTQVLDCGDASVHKHLLEFESRLVEDEKTTAEGVVSKRRFCKEASG